MKIRILLFFTIIMACEKSPLERDVEIFTDSNVKLMLDSMVNVHSEESFSERKPYLYISYVDSNSCSGCELSHFSDWDEVRHNTDTLKYSINRIVAGGETNFYGPLIKALSILKKEDTSNYTTTIVLMTDGQSDKNYYEEFMNYYKNNNLNIPIYSITFGNSNESQLNELASLTNGKVFNGKDGLKQAFKEVRSYN